MKSSRDIGDELEKWVNETFNMKATPNSGGSTRRNGAAGFDHNHPRFVGESKVKDTSDKPTISKSDYYKLLSKAKREGWKDWIYFVRYNGGENIAVILDANIFAEVSHEFWNKEDK